MPRNIRTRSFAALAVFLALAALVACGQPSRDTADTGGPGAGMPSPGDGDGDGAGDGDGDGDGALCGDGIVEGAEACDDGNAVDGDDCSADCARVTGACGDYEVRANEACDDGNAADGDYCSADCQAVTGACGDGVVQGNETCDDGNRVDGDYCSSDCRAVTGACGDGVRQEPEACDDGNRDGADYCAMDCQAVTGACGDGMIQGNEACDDGNVEDDDECAADCTAVTATCGDGVVQDYEACDDGNRDDGDTCSATCDRVFAALGRLDELTAGGAHTCARRGAAVLCWGDNEVGQLGRATRVPPAGLPPTRPPGTPGPPGQRPPWAEPAPPAGPGVVPGLEARELAAGGGLTCAVRAADEPVCWGDNEWGQLGDGLGQLVRLTPTPVPALDAATRLSLSDGTSCGIFSGDSGDVGSTVRCWGEGFDFGAASPVAAGPVPRVIAAARRPSALSVGDGSACAVTDGDVLCWGRISQLLSRDGSARPTRVPELDGATGVSVMGGHGCAVVSAGRVKCWGRNDHGQLGAGERSSTPSVAAVDVVGIDSAVEVAVSPTFSCARLAAGSIRCWGDNRDGVLGRPPVDGGVENSAVPVLIRGVGDTAGLAVGVRHVCVSDEQSVTCWGSNGAGQLGSPPSGLPREPSTAYVGDIAALGTGRWATCALDASGELWCWGSGPHHGALDPTRAPVRVAGIGVGATELSVGSNGVCVGGAARPTSCWGRNSVESLGIALEPRRVEPRAARLGTRATSLSVGRTHACAIDAGGDALCWGRNAEGQLGTGDANDRPEPAPVKVAFDAVDIAAGGRHSCAVLAGGTVACWGDNRFGQLGGGTGAPRREAVLVDGVTDAEAVRAAWATSCARLRDGRVLCWGRLGDVVGRPAQTIANLPPAQSFDLGPGHGCALALDGTVHCWGANASGQLGDGTTVARPSGAAPVAGIERAVGVVVGDAHSCALLDDGTARCWGAAAAGALGANVTADALRPVLVQAPAR